MSPAVITLIPLVLGTGGAALLGLFMSWSASGCYPWRRCDRCGHERHRSGRSSDPHGST